MRRLSFSTAVVSMVHPPSGSDVHAHESVCAGSVDEFLVPYLSLAMGVLARASSTALKILTVNVIADCVYYNAQMTLEALVSQQWLPLALGTWAEVIPLMTRWAQVSCVLSKPVDNWRTLVLCTDPLTGKSPSWG